MSLYAFATHWVFEFLLLTQGLAANHIEVWERAGPALDTWPWAIQIQTNNENKIVH